MTLRDHIKNAVALVSFLFLVALSGCASDSKPTAATATKPAEKSVEKKMLLPVFELPVPSDKSAQEYLGVSGSGMFKLSDIRAKVVIIEVFNMYCPHCQKEAPQVNKLYEVLQEDPDLRNYYEAYWYRHREHPL